MKKIIIMMVAVLCIAPALQAQKAQRIAFVNTNKVLDTLPQMDSAEVMLNKIAEGYQQDAMARQDELNQLNAEIEAAKKDPAFSAVKLDLMQRRLQTLYEDYQYFQNAVNDEMQKERAKLLNPIVDQIKEAVAQVAKTKGFTQVIDNSAEIVIYNGNTTDEITGDVIKYMLAPKPATPAPKK
jgi:Skp family chaperone for outer membrane proteins